VSRHPEAIGLLRLAPGYSVDQEGMEGREQGVLLGLHQKKNA
jgi:hypothetical protein